MRRRRSTPSSAPLLALISCLFVLSWVSSPGSSQLAAYSETRSFRDALEGRSMEEAISGPVDKDTSSYGDRTTSSAGNGESSSSATQKGSSNGNIGGMGDYGGPSQGPTGDSASSTAAGQMMITIPANGNLNPVTTQQRTMEPMDDQQQQKSSSNGGDGELEREAGPISPDFPIDTQQQLMEQQQQMLMMRAKMMGRSGRLTGSEAMPASMMLAMMRTMKEESMKKKNKMMMMKRMQASSPARSGRLQQEQQSEEPTAAPGAGSEKKSYDSDSMPGADGAQMTQPASTNGYGKKLGAQAGNGNGNGNGAYDNGSNKYNNAGSMQDPAGQQPVTMGPGASQEPKGYGGSQGGEQEEEEDMAGFARLQQMSKMADMKSMRAKYAKMMRANTNGAYKKQPTSNMAQSMIMSLANKAAYMANQKQQQQQQPQQPIMSSQRQMAPMMMPQNDGAYGSMAGSTMMNLPGYPQSSARSSYIMPTMSAYLGGAMPAASMQSGNTGNSYRPMGAAGAMRAMRRANQRKPEKKVSPAMMNAMLNKMLGGRQMQADDQSQQTAGNSYAFGRSSSEAPKSMQMAVAEMLMKRPAPARAEMLAQMMLMTNGGGSESPAMSYGGNNNNNNNKRELYKQMMMSAMQQQQQQMNEEPGSDIEQQQQQVGPMNGQANYGERASPAGRSSMVMMAGGANGYNNEAKSGYGGQGAATMSTTPSSYMGGAGTGRAAATMGPSTMSYGTAMGPQQSAMDGTTEGYAGSQEEIPATKGLEQQQEEQSAMPAYGAGMSSPKGGPMMAPKMSYGGSTASERPASNGKLMQQVMKMMRMKQQMSTMNGQQRKTPYGAGNGGEQQQMTTHGGDMEDGNKSPAMNGARQAYQAPASERLQQQQQQQEMQPDSKSYGGSSQGPQLGAYGTMSAAVPAKPNDEPTPAPDSGVKGAGAGGPGMGPMNKPAMSMGMSYNQDQQQQQQQSVGDADEQQQQQADDGQYGAAPMGQAEPFAFDYKVEDEATGNNQYRKEESDKNGVVRGSYGYMDSNSGVYRHVEYVADENGFRANIKSNEPGLSDKTTSQQQQPQQQQMELDRNGLGGSDSGPMAGTKSSSSPSSQGTDAAGPYPSQGQEPAAVPAIPAVGISPPPSSSSSLGGSAALQQEAQLPMIQQQRQMQSMPMGQKMPQDQQKQMSSYQQGQQQQQTSANGEK